MYLKRLYCWPLVGVPVKVIVLQPALDDIPPALASISGLAVEAPERLKDDIDPELNVKAPLDKVSVEPLAPAIVPSVVVPLIVTAPEIVPVPVRVGVPLALAPPTVTAPVPVPLPLELVTFSVPPLTVVPPP